MIMLMALMGVCIVFMGIIISDIGVENRRLRSALGIEEATNLEGKSAEVIYLDSTKKGDVDLKVISSK